MKQFFSDDSVTLYHGDALAILPTIPNASIQLVATDPPYYGFKDHAWDNQWKNADAYLEWIGRILDELRRVLVPNGSLYMFASPDMATGVELEIGKRFRLLNRITWRKADKGGNGAWKKQGPEDYLRAYFPQHEAILFAEQRSADATADGASGYGAACDELHKRVYGPLGAKIAAKRLAAGLERHQVDTACAPSRKPTGLCYRWEEGACLPTLPQWIDFHRLIGDPREYEALRLEYEALRRPFFATAKSQYTDVWDFPTVPANVPGKHPCSKPQSLMQHIVQVSSRPGDTVLDCFAGGGSTLLAARLCGRKAIGIEADDVYCRQTVARLAQGILNFSE